MIYSDYVKRLAINHFIKAIIKRKKTIPVCSDRFNLIKRSVFGQ